MERRRKRLRKLNVSIKNCTDHQDTRQAPSGSWSQFMGLRAAPQPMPFLPQSVTTPVANGTNLCFADKAGKSPLSHYAAAATLRDRVIRNCKPRVVTTVPAPDADAAQSGYSSRDSSQTCTPTDSVFERVDSPMLSPRDIACAVFNVNTLFDIDRDDDDEIDDSDNESATFESSPIQQFQAPPKQRLRLMPTLSLSSAHSEYGPKSDSKDQQNINGDDEWKTESEHESEIEGEIESESEVDSEIEMLELEDVDTEDDDMENVPMMTLLQQLGSTEEDCVLASHGYETQCKLCDCLQGSVYLGRVTVSREATLDLDATSKGQRVVIKAVDKTMCCRKLAVVDDITFVVEEDVRREAEILRSLTTADSDCEMRTVRFVDFFESERYYYLVTRHVDGIELGQFVERAHELIGEGRLSHTEYMQCIKKVFAQLSDLLRVLHNEHGCAHLDLCAENVLLTNVQFGGDGDGDGDEADNSRVTIRGEVELKLIDFGCAEMFRRDAAYFACSKFSLINNATKPLDIGGCTVYDAKAADLWALGALFFLCVTAQALGGTDAVVAHEEDGAHWALRHDQLDAYLRRNQLRRLFCAESFSLLRRFLHCDERSRITATDVLIHPWFQM